MRPRDDDQSVTDMRDAEAIAGRAVTQGDAALAEFAVALRDGARADVPEPSAALADLMAHGTGLHAVEAADDPQMPAVREVRPRRRRVLRVVVGGTAAAALLLGGGAAAAAVRDGATIAEIPGAIGHQVSQAVGGVLEGLGVRERTRDSGGVDGQDGTQRGVNRDGNEHGPRDSTDGGPEGSGGTPGSGQGSQGPSEQAPGQGGSGSEPSQAPGGNGGNATQAPGPGEGGSGDSGSSGGGSGGSGDGSGTAPGTENGPSGQNSGSTGQSGPGADGSSGSPSN